MALKAGSTIGILGGGQLGRMLAMAAARFSYKIVIFDPDASAPAAQVAPATDARLDRIEHAVEAIAVEVERISEGQRFTTKLLAERSTVDASRSVSERSR